MVTNSVLGCWIGWTMTSLPARSSRTNVELPLSIKGLPRGERQGRSKPPPERVKLPDRARQLPHHVFERQRRHTHGRRLHTGGAACLQMSGCCDAFLR